MRVAFVIVLAVSWIALLPATAEERGSGAYVKFTGETRARYESLDGRFRAGRDGSDQALFFRTLLGIEVGNEHVAIGAEMQDSRSYLDDDGTPLSASFVNPADILQLYVKARARGLLGAGSRSETTIGRQTVSIGSKRQIERVSYANVIRAYTGLHSVSTNDRGDALHLLYVVPVSREAGTREEIAENAFEPDREQFGRRIWAVHYRRPDAFPALVSDLWAEAFVYGLDEEDAARVPTPERNYVAPGFRLYRAPARGRWDMDVEGALRLGARAASSEERAEEQKVDASTLIARVGYTADLAWRPRAALQYYWASGDEDPGDDAFDQHERLFGGRRTDLNNTSLHGPLTPANLSAPGLRLDVKPTRRTDARLHYSAAFLASKTDAFVIARRRDASGRSGDFLGHTLDARARYRLWDDRLVFEVGGSAFLFGEFTRNAPGASGDARTLFGYAHVTARL